MWTDGSQYCGSRIAQAAASEWFDNWGFLANKPQPPPKGFSTRTAKYAFGGTNWTLEQKRVPDESAEGISAAEAERNIRRTMANLTWQSKPFNATKPCEAKGAYKGMVLVESDTSGVKHREAVSISLFNAAPWLHHLAEATEREHAPLVFAPVLAQLALY